ncbi:MAG: ChaN family lipoprotein [Rhizobiaceae bacterium]
MERLIFRSVVCLLVFWFAIFAKQSNADEIADWQSTEEVDHPLAGKIVDSTGQIVDLPEVIDAAARVDYVLLGETHDNADHHRLQAQIISELGALQQGDTASVVFEMLNYDQQDEIDRLMANPDPEDFGRSIGWETSGWPDWEHYQPIMEALVDHEMAVIAGSPNRDTVKAVGRKGVEALSQEQQIRFGLDITLEDNQTNGLLDAVDIGHCGLVPKTDLAPMVNVQRLKDGALADAMMSARAENGPDSNVFLIAGSGHVRKDYAVPAIIRNREPDAGIVTISFREVVNDYDYVSDYFSDKINNDVAEDPAFDFIWFTPRTKREDPCEKLRQHFGEKG